MWFLLLLSTLYFVTARASNVIFEDCGSAYNLQSVNIEGCGFLPPCYVTLGDRIPVSLQFYADFVSSHLAQDVSIQINYINARTPVTPESCETELCPVQTGTMTSLTSIMSVPTDMALHQRGYLQWRVHNEAGLQVLCYYVMVETQDYVSKMRRQYKHNLYFDRIFRGISMKIATNNNFTSLLHT